ncbi:MAG: thioredoxin-disulfide reductase [Syntrophomonadaceae bacterium]|nr:thioredoxin-disulfide reductase [Syntrophomonadaceae bacterium]
MYDVIILGGGPAGLSAAIYTGRAWLKTLVLESAVVGGNAAIADQIDNYPGFPFGILGGELMENFRKQAERFGAEIRIEEVVKIVDTPKGRQVITSEGEYLTRAIIIATGAQRRELGIEGEQEFLGRGVSYCATCDGAFFRNFPVAVVGGGESALKEALYLADIASKVYLVHRREEFRASADSVARLRNHPKIESRLNRIIKRIEGDTVMRRLILQDVQSEQEEVLEVEGLFVSIGMVAATEFIAGLINTEDGYIVTDDSMQTSVKGIFAAGDIRSKRTRQIATAVGDGASAGMAVTEYLKE